VLAGIGRLAGTRMDFEIGTVEHPGALPVELRGSYDAGELHLSRARSDTVRQRSRELQPGI